MQDRLVQGLIGVAALICFANGLFMLFAPLSWYEWLPTVRFTGPANSHFIRDIALAYLLCAASLGFAVPRPSMRWLALFAGGLWLTGHGLLHIWEVLTGVCAPAIFWQDAPGVLGPPLLVWIALVMLFVRQRVAPAGVPDLVFLRAIGDLSPGEMEYFQDIAECPGGALEKLKHAMPLSMHRHDAPTDLFHMARIGATLVEDCGPCALTAAEGALRDGVDRDLINAALSADPPDGDWKTAFVFGAAIAKQSPEAAALGDMLEERFGRSVRAELAIAAAIVRMYPAMKRGLGYSQSCALTKLEV